MFYRFIYPAVVQSVVLAIVIPMASSARSSPTDTYILKARAEVSAKVVRFGDLVEECRNSELQALKIFPSPPWGESRVVENTEVLKRLLHLTPVKLSLKGSDTVTIVRPGGDRSNEIEALVRDAIARYATHFDGLSYELSFPAAPIRLPWGDLDVSCGLPDDPIGLRMIRCRIRVGGRAVKNASFACGFSRTLRVPVASRRLTRGDTLRSGDVIWEERTYDARLPKLIDPDASGGSYRVKRVIRENDLISLAAVERHPAVKVGQIVDVVIQRSSVRVTTKAKALQTGWVGSRIRLQNLVDKSFVRGRVIGEGVVAYE